MPSLRKHEAKRKWQPHFTGGLQGVFPRMSHPHFMTKVRKQLCTAKTGQGEHEEQMPGDPQIRHGTRAPPFWSTISSHHRKSSCDHMACVGSGRNNKLPVADPGSSAQFPIRETDTPHPGLFPALNEMMCVEYQAAGPARSSW